MTRNQIAFWELVENRMHNRATEKEANRSNVARENETHRSNVQNEMESRRHNILSETLQGKDISVKDKVADETKRHNLAMEQFNKQQNELGWANLGNEQRKTENAYILGTRQARENERANRANEAIRSGELAVHAGQLDETVQHNRNTEMIQSANALTTGYKNVMSGLTDAFRIHAGKL